MTCCNFCHLDKTQHLPCASKSQAPLSSQFLPHQSHSSILSFVFPNTLSVWLKSLDPPGFEGQSIWAAWASTWSPLGGLFTPSLETMDIVSPSSFSSSVKPKSDTWRKAVAHSPAALARSLRGWTITQACISSCGTGSVPGAKRCWAQRATDNLSETSLATLAGSQPELALLGRLTQGLVLTKDCHQNPSGPFRIRPEYFFLIRRTWWQAWGEKKRKARFNSRPHWL